MLLPLAVAAAGALQLLIMWSNRAQRFRALAISRVLQYGGAALFQVALGGALWWSARQPAGAEAAWALVIAPVLAGFRPLVRMSERGHMDGGDVLLVDKQFFIGLTARTDEQGIREFAAAVEPHGYQVAAIEVSAGLHLKSIVNYVGRNTLLLTEGYVNHPAFNGFNSIVIPEEEAYAGNTLWINDSLITPQGYPHTLGEISKLGMPIVQLDTSEFKKMDGGLTCLSLRF